MKQNIFQKIVILVYILVVLLICVYFVPYYDGSIGSYHSSILDEGYGSMSYFRLLLYFAILGSLVYFLHGYLSKLSDLGTNEYKKKAKNELYVFFVFVSIIAGTVLFLYGNNEYSEIRKETLKSEISKIETQLNKIEEESQSILPVDGVDEILKGNSKKPWEKNYEVVVSEEENKPPLPKGYEPIKKGIVKPEFDEFGIAIKKPPFNPNEPYDDVLVKKENLELKLKNILFYNDVEIKDNIVFMFLASFILLYIIRPLFSMFKEMLGEVK